ncbi:MAG: zinc-ribbon domain-containing protein [Ruminococcaceae bacterium]|nr:zinc-ribbon domain-containing protein [Oscillospiraceae bacterium]
MKICPNCNNQLEDNAAFCNNCGFSFNAKQQSAQFTASDPFDHTAEFDPKDISENKVISMLVYLLGPIGIIIALLASSTSAYAAFHVRQALKFTVVEILVAICTALLCWTCIVPVAAGILYIVLFVLKIVSFFQICKGQAKEPALIRDLKFLK